MEYVPKVYGFKIYGRKGSKYEMKQEKRELTHYTPEELKKIKARNENKMKREKMWFSRVVATCMYPGNWKARGQGSIGKVELKLNSKSSIVIMSM